MLAIYISIFIPDIFRQSAKSLALHARCGVAHGGGKDRIY